MLDHPIISGTRRTHVSIPSDWVTVYATSDIEAGEELFVNYDISYWYDDDGTTIDPTFCWKCFSKEWEEEDNPLLLCDGIWNGRPCIRACHYKCSGYNNLNNAEQKVIDVGPNGPDLYYCPLCIYRLDTIGPSILSQSTQPASSSSDPIEDWSTTVQTSKGSNEMNDDA
jgi:hypothetical protein